MIYFKTFDTVPMQTLHMVMIVAGVPAQSMRPCVIFNENMTMRNVITGCAGTTYERQRSIAQGDPWSVMRFVLFLRPVAAVASANNAEARLLADGLLLRTSVLFAHIGVRQAARDVVAGFQRGSACWCRRASAMPWMRNHPLGAC